MNQIDCFWIYAFFSPKSVGRLRPGVLLIFLLFPGGLSAQVHKPTKTLDSLFKERQEVYSHAKEIYEQNNAWFGGKAKRDLIDAIEELKKVVAIDNKIVLEIERMRLANEFERFSTEGEMLKSTERVQDLEAANSRLQKQISERDAQFKELQGEVENGKRSRVTQSFLLVMLFISNGVMIWLLVRKKKPEPEEEADV